MKLTNRARIWGLLCRYALADPSALAPRERLYQRDPSDAEALLTRLTAAGLVERHPEGARLTAAGQDRARATLRDGVVPRIIMHDPREWRQRAWQAMRIHGTFTAADIARVADAPSYLAVQRYCSALRDAGHLLDGGWRADGSRRLCLYRVSGPTTPVPPLDGEPATPRAAQAARAADKRAWSAMVRLGRAGAGFTRTDVVVAAGVPYATVHLLMEKLVAAGALVRAERRGLAVGGWEWLYALSPDPDHAAQSVLRPGGWRQRAWRCLRAEDGPVTLADFAARIGVPVPTMYAFLETLVRAGLAECEYGAWLPGGNSSVPSLYRAVPGAPADLPVLELKPRKLPPRPRRDGSETAGVPQAAHASEVPS